MPSFTSPQTGAKHHGSSNVRPKDPKERFHNQIDSREKYPSTIEFASKPEETPSRVNHCKEARRPGGEYRASHGFKTIACHCGGHPCKCGTEEAKKHVIQCNINE